MIYRAIKDLAQYGIAKGLIEKEDEIYVINSTTMNQPFVKLMVPLP